MLADWMDKTLRLGYFLQFCRVPAPFSGIKEINLSSQEEIDFLFKEILDLLLKQAVSVVPTHDRQKGFYSAYFLVPKKTGGDWFTTIDLKDAYHVEVVPKHRKFLFVAFQGIAYEYNRLSFGYSLASCTFSKCVDAALQPLCDCGMRVPFYLDDLFVMAQTQLGFAIK